MRGSGGMSPALRRRVERGAYVVDESAVAEAIVGRIQAATEQGRLVSAMRVAAQLDRQAVPPGQLDAPFFTARELS
jgi:hypothetical protein